MTITMIPKAHLCESSDDSAECFKELQDASEERCQVYDLWCELYDVKN